MMNAHERELFQASLRHATSSHTGGALDRALDELGWPDALVTDRRAAVSLLFEQQGAANATSSALDLVLAGALGFGPDPVAVVLPPLGGGDPPGQVEGEGVTVRGLGTAALTERDSAIVVAAGSGGEISIVVVETKDLACRLLGGLDPALGMVEVGGDRMRATLQPSSPDAWSDAVTAGRLAVAHELVGAAEVMLRLARDHAVDRIQFGRPISMFQAVRHRLAESHVAVEAADAVLVAAWDNPSPLTASLAKAVAGRTARTVGKHAQQVLAGIGFTTEHPFHRYLFRTMVLDKVLGDARSLTQALGEGLLKERRLPPMLPL
jgi:hypothetical protein